MNPINDRTDHYFIPNSVITYEDCPVCKMSDMRVEHGKDGRGSLQHFEHCTECGDSMPIVCYDCVFCQMTLEDDMKSSNWIGYDLATTNAEAREQAAVKLKVPEERVEILRTGGAVLARVRQESTK